MIDSVAALYVDPLGPYPGLVRDWYDAEKDARSYPGPLPVVAHPPCGPWGCLRHLSKKDDPGLAIHAVAQVRLFGGVLEHPRASKLWDHFGLPKPGDPVDAFGGWTLRVDQSDFGHVARKPTWLYIVRASLIPYLPPRREPTHWIGGDRTNAKGNKRPSSLVPAGIKVCSAQQRRRTPPDFARFLLTLAGSVK